MKNKKILIIAEAGVNHNGSVKTALKLCKIAKNSGADYVKFQIFNAEEQVSKFAKTANYQKKQTNMNNMIGMVKSFTLSLHDHLKIKNYCKKIKIKYLASCFDIKSTKFYKNKLNQKEIKIGSGEITNYPLLKYISKKFEKIILSTGMANISEIKKAVKILKNKANDVCIMHCNSNYPTKLEDVNLNTIKFLKRELKLNIGFSDHTTSTETGKLAVACGAKILEKHFTFSNRAIGPDHKMSLNPAKLKNYIYQVNTVSKILGFEKKILNVKELKMIKFARRGVVAKKNLKKGSTIDLQNFTFKRPCIGIPCEDFHLYKGKKLKKKMSYDQNLRASYLQ